LDLQLTPKQLISLSPADAAIHGNPQHDGAGTLRVSGKLALENPVVDLEEPDENETIAKWRQKLDWLSRWDRPVARRPCSEADAQEQFISPYGGRGCL
jgi:hypothetical protein